VPNNFGRDSRSATSLSRNANASSFSPAEK
jgi:hypothetical protein